jgi:hypothetical protein
MITYDKKTETVTMDLINLEHCGFNQDEFLQELFLSGIDEKGCTFPNKIVINFRKIALTLGEQKYSG